MWSKTKDSWNLGEIKPKSGDAPIWTVEKVVEDQDVPRPGMGYWVAGYFLIAQMAGAGFLALPKAFSNTGWTGLGIITLFCILVGFSGTRLGKCWVILEERWTQYKQPARQPYMEIAERAYGKMGRYVILVCVLLTVFGAGVVYTILMAQFLNSLIPSLSMCKLIVIVGACLLPFTWPGTPKDFWQGSVLAVVATLIACAVIFVQLLLEDDLPTPVFDSPTLATFCAGFGTFVFAFGGASVFPTIQNDMIDRSQFWKSVVIAFAVLIFMYLPVAITGYALLGSSVPGNILVYSGEKQSIAIKIAIVFELVNLFVTYLVAFNPLCQAIEDIINIAPRFSIQRCGLRSLILAVEVLVALAIPNFGSILNLIGASTVTTCSFLAPCLCYMKLVNDKSNPDWPQRTIATWEKFVLYLIMLLGLVGGVISTVFAVMDIVSTPFSSTCFASFF